MSAILANLLKLVDSPRDGALLRYSIGSEYLKQADAPNALIHFRAALRFDPHYSAAWKLLGKTLAESGDADAALKAYEEGIAAAETRGDRQAVKEMRVFAKRLQKPAPGAAPA